MKYLSIILLMLPAMAVADRNTGELLADLNDRPDSRYGQPHSTSEQDTYNDSGVVVYSGEYMTESELAANPVIIEAENVIPDPQPGQASPRPTRQSGNSRDGESHRDFLSKIF